MITKQTRWESYKKSKPKMPNRRAEILEALGDKEMTAREIFEEIRKKSHRKWRRKWI